mmetsp:Transcript_15069/g.13221  ORF Transcript_15069/g.13221 Transcript_15069/m.13221 type:complete len:157 (-) Transcript_15069:60-530(-)
MPNKLLVYKKMQERAKSTDPFSKSKCCQSRNKFSVFYSSTNRKSLESSIISSISNKKSKFSFPTLKRNATEAILSNLPKSNLICEEKEKPTKTSCFRSPNSKHQISNKTIKAQYANYKENKGKNKKSQRHKKIRGEKIFTRSENSTRMSNKAVSDR